jgi:putative ribosome biogenesis GTPase RsgA
VKNDLYGAHTTSNTKLYDVDKVTNTRIMDSPGIRELSLSHFRKSDVDQGFKEIHKHAQMCKFRNCDHFVNVAAEVEEIVAQDTTVLDRCSVLRGVHEGTIDAERYRSYKYIVRHLLKQ